MNPTEVMTAKITDQVATVSHAYVAKKIYF
jgi:hypothetical protein